MAFPDGPPTPERPRWAYTLSKAAIVVVLVGVLTNANVLVIGASVAWFASTMVWLDRRGRGVALTAAALGGLTLLLLGALL